MKRNIFSVLLVCLMLVSVLLLSGCKTDELEAQINENASAAEGAVSDAISKSEAAVAAAAKQAAADLAAAQEELEKLIADGNVANADALDAAVEAFNAAMADAEAAIADLEEITADNSEDLYDEIDALETDLITAIHDASQAVAAAAAQNLAAVKAELLAVIADGDYASSAELSAAVAEAVEGLSALIATVQKADMSYADSLKAELDTKLSAAIDDVAATAAKDLEAATAKLEAAIALKADATALEAAVADYSAKVAAAEAAATVADGVLKAELVGKIEAADAALDTAVKKVAADLETATAKLEAALKADATALEAAVADYSAKVAAAEAAATAADGVLKTELVAKIEAADAALDTAVKKVAADLEAATIALETLIAEKATFADVEAAKSELVEEIQDLEELIDALSGTDKELNLTGLKDYVDAQINAAKDAVLDATVKVAEWDGATPAVIDAITTISKHYYSTNKDLYYVDQQAELGAIFEAMKVRLTRAIDADAVKDVLDETQEDSYYAAIDSVLTKADIILAGLTKYGSTVEEVLLNDDWKAAIEDAEKALAKENDPVVLEALEDVQTLADAFRARYDFLAGKKTDATVLNDRAIALLTALAAEQGYNADTKAEYAALKAEIADWYEDIDEAHATLLDDSKVAELDTLYAELETAYNNAAAEVAALLNGFNGEYVYNYGEETYKAVTDANQAYTDWAADVVARGFALDGAVEAPAVAAYEIFAEGTLARAEALEAAAVEAAAIEAAVEALVAELNSNVVKSAYADTKAEILAAVAAWDADYFEEPFAAEAVAGNANYDILDHAAVAALEELYAAVMNDTLKLADALAAALAEIENVDIYSEAAIDAADAAFKALCDHLGDKEYEINSIPSEAELAAALADKRAAFDKIVADAIASYAPITDKEVTLASGDAVAALATWFETYFGIDVATEALPVTEVVLSDTFTVNAETVATAKAAVDAYNYLTEKKAEEFATLEATLEALLAKAPSTALAEEIATAFDNYDAWLEGTACPEGYEATQFIPINADALDALFADLNALSDDVKALELERDALIDRIELLVLDYKKLNTPELQIAAQGVIDVLNADIASFTAANAGVYCFEAYDETLDNAQIAIDQAKSIDAFAVTYATLIAEIETISNDAVANANIARAEAILADAVKTLEEKDILAAIAQANEGFAALAVTIANDRAAIAALNVIYDEAILRAADISDARVADYIYADIEASYAKAADAIIANDADTKALAEAELALSIHTSKWYKATLIAGVADPDVEDKLYDAYMVLQARADMVSADQLAAEEEAVIAAFTAVHEVPIDSVK